MVYEVDEPSPKVLEGPVPLAVPVTVRDQDGLHDGSAPAAALILHMVIARRLGE
jgi:hypothetical protein